jgi:hypothetical protein
LEGAVSGLMRLCWPQSLRRSMPVAGGVSLIHMPGEAVTVERVVDGAGALEGEIGHDKEGGSWSTEYTTVLPRDCRRPA